MQGRPHSGYFGALVLCATLTGPCAWGAEPMHQHGSMPVPSQENGGDTREVVRMPHALREHTLANMRDHLAALTEIQDALARGQFDAAADIAEQRLGMSSLQRHGAHEVGRYMPAAMRETGMSLHHNASRFALEAREADVTNDYGKALGAFREVMRSCVACHAGFRVEDLPPQ